MKPNGRRAWRRAAKKLRRKMGRRWRSQEEWVYGKRWSELVPDLAAHRGHICGPWFKRHGFQSLDQESSSRHYIGLWGTVDGDTIGFVEAARPFTARSLVGMTMGSKKRIRRSISKLLARMHANLASLGYQHDAVRNDSFLRIGERLRPCPGCCACWGHRISSAYGEIAECCGPQTIGKRKSQIKAMRKWQETLADDCDGSGVLPARRP